jgi:GNAT superfamily N-acetyltransferase
MEQSRTGNGVPFEPSLLDLVEQQFWWEIWDTVPTEVAAERGIEGRHFGPVQVTTVAALPAARMLNLVLGASAADAVDGGHLAEALDWAESRAVVGYVPVTERAPGAQAAGRLLASRGYERGYAWMKFVRDAHPPRFVAPPDVEVNELNDGDDEAFGMIAATGFGLPAWAAAFFAGLPERPNWRCYVTRVDGEPAACAAMLIDGDTAEFGIAATLETARGRGCQTALLHRRIADAAAAGCRTLFVETGERTADRPSASYRNILRAGFEEAYLRPNWQLPAAAD